MMINKIDLLRGAERVCWTKWSVAERGDCKRRGRGLGQRNNKIKFYNKNSHNITNCAKEKFKTDIIFHQTEDRH